MSWVKTASEKLGHDIVLLSFAASVTILILYLAFGELTSPNIEDVEGLHNVKGIPERYLRDEYGRNLSMNRLPPVRGDDKRILARSIVDLDKKGRILANVIVDDCVSEVYVNKELVFYEEDCSQESQPRGLVLDLSESLSEGRNTLDFKVVNSTGHKEAYIIWLNNDFMLIKYSITVLFAAALLVCFIRSEWMRSMFREYLPLLALIVFFAYTLSQNTEHSMDSGHNAFNFGKFSRLARNTLEYGLVKTKFGQLESVDSTGKMRYYINHPPLLTNYVALSYLILLPLGWTYWSAAALVPTLFSLASLTLLYLIAKRLWGTNVAFLSTLAMASTPMFKKYGQLLAHEPPTTFFILAVVYAYILWVETKEKRYFKATLALMVVGCFTGWPAYYTIPLLTVHYLIYGEEKRKALIFPVVGLIAFSLFLTHIHVLEGTGALPKLYKAIKQRGSYDEEEMMWRGENVKVFIGEINNIKKANTPHLYYASGLLLASIAYGVLKKKSVRSESYVLILILVACIHNILWPVGIGFHDYWSYYFTPALSLAAVVGVNSVINGGRGYRTFVLWATALVYWILNTKTGF